jgi:retron-type reverse transcriptase
MLLMLTCQNTIDTIAHEKLMKTVAEKIADKSILGILNQWLKAIVIKVEKERQTVIGGGKKNRHGTPQGGVISPLLARMLHPDPGFWPRDFRSD